MKTINAINKYMGQTLDLGHLDCLTMLFEVLGRADLLESTKGRYTTILGALRSLPKVTGIKSIRELLGDCEVIENGYFVQDGDLVISEGRHCYIYFSGSLFGVWDADTFGFRPIELPLQIENSTIYRLP
ncbi:DUF6950 family protein [Aeromonas piscicola]|uniref:DUF6950 family protein n=1 Tax=Aeromonas piscicola TaxID=600645 RepID=UPI0005B35026